MERERPNGLPEEEKEKVLSHEKLKDFPASLLPWLTILLNSDKNVKEKLDEAEKVSDERVKEIGELLKEYISGLIGERSLELTKDEEIFTPEETQYLREHLNEFQERLAAIALEQARGKVGAVKRQLKGLKGYILLPRTLQEGMPENPTFKDLIPEARLLAQQAAEQNLNANNIMSMQACMDLSANMQKMSMREAKMLIRELKSAAGNKNGAYYKGYKVVARVMESYYNLFFPRK